MLNAAEIAERTTPRARRFKVVLINPYELGRQSFNIASPAALLKSAGCDVVCIDLALQRLEPALLADANLVAIHLGMHTATRIAIAALPRIRSLASDAHISMYGLYAAMNESLLRSLGVDTLLSGEFESGLTSLVHRLRGHGEHAQPEPLVNLSRVSFETPDRAGLPPLSRYAHLTMPDGQRKMVGFADTTRGCKHLCRHCPIVPVYQGRFRAIDRDIVLADIAQQVAMGAAHISFGDPDFFNGPTHALKILGAMHAQFPRLTFDATIKISHLIEHADDLPPLRDCGCLFITSAVESMDDAVLDRLDKGHTRAEFERALALCRANDIALAPTFIPFTPWTTLEGYVDLLREILRLRLIGAVPPVQLAIRLLVPQGSYLLRLPGFAQMLESFDPVSLGYPWRHDDARVDALQRDVHAIAMRMEGRPRVEAFTQIWNVAHAALSVAAPDINVGDADQTIPRLSEPWYCCAEPTEQQLQSF